MAVTVSQNSVTTSLTQIIEILTSANVAVPIILGTVTTVIGIVKMLRGEAPPLADIIAEIEKQIALNQAKGEAEIARLKSLIE